jgi:hypothetical protein
MHNGHHSKSNASIFRTNIRMGELRRLFRYRHHIRDQTVSSLDLDLQIHDKVGNPWEWTAEQLGNLVELTYEERTILAIRSFQCFDKTPAEVKAIQNARKRIRDRVGASERRKRERETRAAARAMSVDLDDRKETLFIVIGQDWRSVAQIMVDVGHLPVWKMPDGKPLSGNSLRRVVNRQLSHLIEERQIERKSEAGPRGKQIGFFRRGKRCQ